MFKWPLFFYADAKDDTLFANIELAVIQNLNLLPIFTSEETAKQLGSELIPSRFKLKKLGSNGFLKLLETVALPKGITKAILYPDLSTNFQQFSIIDLEKFIEDNRKMVHRNDSCPCGSGIRYKHCHGKL